MSGGPQYPMFRRAQSESTGWGSKYGAIVLGLLAVAEAIHDLAAAVRSTPPSPGVPS